MNTLISVLFVIFGVLQIILFFKVWSMTNDVKKLKENVENNNDLVTEAKIAALKGDKSKAKEILDTSFFKEILLLNDKGDHHYSYYYESISKRYKDIYTKLEIESLDFEKYKDNQSIFTK